MAKGWRKMCHFLEHAHQLSQNGQTCFGNLDDARFSSLMDLMQQAKQDYENHGVPPTTPAQIGRLDAFNRREQTLAAIAIARNHTLDHSA